MTKMEVIMTFFKRQIVMRLTILLFAFLALVVLCQWTFASGKMYGSITGTVVSAQTGKPIPGANIIVVGTLLGAASDLGGKFIILRVPVGVYSVKATAIGFESQTKADVVVRTGETTELHFSLKETVIETPTLIVTASKRHQDILDSPISVGVVTSSQIREKNEIYLDEILQYAPGVNFMASQVSIRGSSGYSHGAGTRVLFLIDGVPVLPGDSGDIKWDLVPATQIERVEIVKGAGSALYGSNALGGVINIITKEPSLRPITNVRFSAGVFDRPAHPEWRWTNRILHFSDMDVTHSRTVGGIDLVLSVGRRQSTGYRQNGNYCRWNAMGKATYRPSGQSRLMVNANWSHDKRGNSFMWQSQNHPLKAPKEAADDQIKSYKFNFSSVYRHAVSEFFGLKVRSSYFRNRWENFFHDNNDYSQAQRFGVELQGDLVLGKCHSITFGSEEVFNYVNSSMFDKHDAYGLSFYVQDEIKLPANLLLTLGVRYDISHVDVGIDESQLSPKMGLVWHATSTTTLRASSGRGFRAPSVAERFTNVVVSGLRVIPNLKLTAETAWSHEVGIHQFLGKFLVFDLAIFYSDYWDLIEPQPDASGTVQFINVTRARIRGMESSTQVSFWKQHLALSLAYTWLDPKDLSLGQVLAYRARNQFTGSFTFSYGVFQGGMDYRYVSRLERVKVYPRDERVPQKVLDVRVGFKFGKFHLAANIDNVFNYNYTQVERTLMPIRHYTLTLTADF